MIPDGISYIYLKEPIDGDYILKFPFSEWTNIFYTEKKWVAYRAGGRMVIPFSNIICGEVLYNSTEYTEWARENGIDQTAIKDEFEL